MLALKTPHLPVPWAPSGSCQGQFRWLMLGRNTWRLNRASGGRVFWLRGPRGQEPPGPMAAFGIGYPSRSMTAVAVPGARSAFSKLEGGCATGNSTIPGNPGRLREGGR